MQGAARRRAADARVRLRQQITVQAALPSPARPTDANTHPETKPLALETAAAWLCQLRARKARAALRVRKAFAVRNADARFVRGRVVRRHKLHRLRGDERNLKLHGQMDGVLDIDRFFGLVGALHLDIETVREQARPALRALPRRLHIARGNGESDIALLRAR